MKDIEYMLISYQKDGEDFLYRDNHGTVTLCKDCNYYNKRMFECCMNRGEWKPSDHCSKGKRKDEK